MRLSVKNLHSPGMICIAASAESRLGFYMNNSVLFCPSYSCTILIDSAVIFGLRCSSLSIHLFVH
ncbi:unnamed protein product [Brugia pahangi]|uniref:Ovule protein n=1 Tax=Brugia pahangi TaxID=6280 RepID=A0A0N4SYG9_BRUPA|nr:unnamed protein product [Brugia pahangi]